jgi:uncharacterized protein YutE (UPF0331/DUF86 family)
MSIEDKPYEPLSRGEIEKSLQAVRELARENRTLPALIMAWATLEAVGRAMLPSKFPKAQTPGRLVDVLAAHGQLSPSEAEHLRRMAQIRNRLVHGAFQVAVPKSDLDYSLGLISRMLKEIPIDFADNGDPQSSEDHALG